MIEKSELFVKLNERFNELSGKFLRQQVESEALDPLGFTPDLDQIAAFKLLFHAEIEDYLELKAKKYLTELESNVLSGGDLEAGFSLRANLNLYLLAGIFEIPIPTDCPFDRIKFTNCATLVFKTARGFITNNNGIKERSFMTLAIICGKMPDEMDISLFALLNQYGKERGNIAHQSTTRVRETSSPSSEQTTAHTLIAAIERYFY
jgi:hypothetical protein